MKCSIFITIIFVGSCWADFRSYDSIVTAVKQKCTALGGSGSFEKLTASLNGSISCFDESRGIISVIVEQLQKSEANRLEIYLTDLGCTKLEELKQCNKIARDNVINCLTHSEKKNYDTTLDLFGKIYEYVCQITVENREYFESTKTSVWTFNNLLQNCTSKYFPNLETFLVSGGILYTPTDTTVCRYSEEWRNCVESEPLPAPFNSTNIKAHVMAYLDQIVNFVKYSDICKYQTSVKRHRRSLKRTVRSLAATSKINEVQTTFKELCTGHLTTLEDSFDKAETCLQKHELFSINKTAYLAHLDHCTKNAITLLEKCLPAEDRYLPKLLLEIAKSVVKFFYDDVREMIAFGYCVPKLETAENTLELEVCVESKGEIDEDVIPSKAVFCRRFIDMSKCMTDQVGEVCDKTKEIDTFRQHYLRAVSEPCK